MLETESDIHDCLKMGYVDKNILGSLIHMVFLHYLGGLITSLATDITYSFPSAILLFRGSSRYKLYRLHKAKIKSLTITNAESSTQELPPHPD